VDLCTYRSRTAVVALIRKPHRSEERDVSSLRLIDGGLYGDNRQIDISDKDSGVLDRDILGPLLLYSTPLFSSPPALSPAPRGDYSVIGGVKSLLALRRPLE